MIEVFKTNVENSADAEIVLGLLRHHFPKSRINFDLQDCDKILRLEGGNFCTTDIMMIVSKQGFLCQVLE